MSESDEIHPFLIYRVNGNQMECSLWTLEGGARALTLFLTRERAAAYRSQAALSAEWKIWQPPKSELFKLLRGCHQSGVVYAVLDPDNAQAARLFDIAQILAAGQG
jgi:hypothetical protein